MPAMPGPERDKAKAKRSICCFSSETSCDNLSTGGLADDWSARNEVNFSCELDSLSIAQTTSYAPKCLDSGAVVLELTNIASGPISRCAPWMASSIVSAKNDFSLIAV